MGQEMPQLQGIPSHDCRGVIVMAPADAFIQEMAVRKAGFDAIIDIFEGPGVKTILAHISNGKSGLAEIGMVELLPLNFQVKCNDDNEFLIVV